MVPCPAKQTGFLARSILLFFCLHFCATSLQTTRVKLAFWLVTKVQLKNRKEKNSWTKQPPEAEVILKYRLRKNKGHAEPYLLPELKSLSII